MSERAESVAALIARQRVIPVLRAPTFTDPSGMARALIEAGFPVMEFTFTADNALDAIAAAAELDGVVGAGTVTTAAQARSAHDAGAAFLVSPAVIPDVAGATGLPTMLAGLTPTELYEADRLSGWLVKLFPASTVGPPHIRSVLTVFPHLRVVATGGIRPENVASVMAAGAVAVASGYPGTVGGRLDIAAVVEGARSLRESTDGRAG